jgi:hypothetical protein
MHADSFAWSASSSGVARSGTYELIRLYATLRYGFDANDDVHRSPRQAWPALSLDLQSALVLRFLYCDPGGSRRLHPKPGSTVQAAHAARPLVCDFSAGTGPIQTCFNSSRSTTQNWLVNASACPWLCCCATPLIHDRYCHRYEGFHFLRSASAVYQGKCVAHAVLRTACRRVTQFINPHFSMAGMGSIGTIGFIVLSPCR